MSLLEMSLYGGMMILAIVVLRALALNRLPKGTFLALWAAAVVRLLVPFDIPSPASVYSLAGDLAPKIPAASAAVTAVTTAPVVPTVTAAAPAANYVPAVTASTSTGTDFPVWTAVWLTGVVLCVGFFAFSYFRYLREFRASLPVEEEAADRWLADHPLRRRVTVRQSDKIAAPLTYGILWPVILFPKSTDWNQPSRLEWVLEHESVHIRRFDGVGKLLLAAAVCVHWFNPLVWVMYVLANRDIELSCDEHVVQKMGLDKRSAYARTLIDLEAEKSGLGPFASAFSKNAIEERITAIMKLKKISLVGILAAVLLVCGVTAACATSAADKDTPRPNVQAGTFTEAELDRLAAVWFEGYGDMTVADYQQKMWTERDNAADIELLDRYGQYRVSIGYWGDDKATEKANAFDDYFMKVYEPLTAEYWQRRTYRGLGADFAEYEYALTILDRDTLTVGDFEKTRKAADAFFDQPLEGEEDAARVNNLSTDALKVELLAYISRVDGPDTALYAASSQESAAQWDAQLAPYVPLGLTYEFDDPDLDGNGLTMWFNGKEVRAIVDGDVWIAEHTGDSFSADAVTLFAVYTDGKLTGLQESYGEQREFPQATQADYDSILQLMKVEAPADLPASASVPYRDYRDLPLAEFNQKLLDWANENPDAWNRICCDVLWDDYAVELEPWEKQFVSLTCQHSGTENGMAVRALYTGQEQDPSFAASLPERSQTMDDNVVAAWCDLYYDISYHVSDQSACTVGERDACVGNMRNAIAAFWQDTDLDTLLAMSETDVANQFNTWAEHCNTDHVSFHHVTEDHIHYDCGDERHLYSETEHHPEPEHTTPAYTTAPPSAGTHHEEAAHHSGHHG